MDDSPTLQGDNNRFTDTDLGGGGGGGMMMMVAVDDQVEDITIRDELEQEDEQDEFVVHLRDPSTSRLIPLVSWVMMVVFLLLMIGCIVMAILFGIPWVTWPTQGGSGGSGGGGSGKIPDRTPGRDTVSFDVPTEAIFASLTAGFLGLFVVTYLTLRVLSSPVGVNEKRGARMYEISRYIADGARAFLVREFQVLSVFVVVVTGLLCLVDQSGYYVATPLCFLVGALTSAVTSVIGMSIATAANVRTANAARRGLNPALKVAFNAGTVMGLSVVGLGLLVLAALYLVFRDLAALAGMGFGASSIALFARVGGGIYTKAADVGADLVGKVEANIPEDDPRNPAVIADNVGDNVGDVAGMGADLFESYVGSIIAAMTIGAEYFGARGVACPLYLSAGGILCSVIGSFIVSTREDKKAGTPPPSPPAAAAVHHQQQQQQQENGMESEHLGVDILEAGSAQQNDQHQVQNRLLFAIRKGTFVAAALNTLLGALVIFLLFDFATQAWQLLLCFVVGLVAGVLIGLATEYCTSFSYRPTQSIARAGETGAATVVIKGLSIGMLSTVAPVVIIVLSIVCAVMLGESTSDTPGAGIYGISIAAVGMLSTLGITLATDAYGPVADNAGGLAEMSGLPEEVRQRTDALDALGNTTAATGKGFAIGSAVLTALALMSAYSRAAGITVINVLEFQVISGILLGACLPFVFAALCMTAVGDAAMSIIVEVRRQFATIPGLLEGRKGVVADHNKCVAIATTAAFKKMILPGLLTVLAPVVIGFAGRQRMLGGLLVGSIASGFLLAVTMANAGGAWDNAKKYIEAGSLKNAETGEVLAKGSEAHKAAVVGDTIGDPFKDTSGPAINILIKLMTILSLVIAPVLKSLFPLG